MNEQEEKMLNEIDGAVSSESATADDVFEALFNIEDSQFELIAPVMLESIETQLSDPATQIAFINNFRKSDGNIDDINKLMVEIINAIDTEYADISDIKRDFLKQIFYYCANALNQANDSAKQVIVVPFEKISDNAKCPTYANIGDAGADIYALEDITIKPGETILVPTGLKMAIPQGYEIQVRPKSGRCLKTKLRVANTPGTIDSGYREEIKVIIDNIEPPVRDIKIFKTEDGQISNIFVIPGDSYTINAGEKFAQLVLCQCLKASYQPISDVSEIGFNRGGGFGSTGV